MTTTDARNAMAGRQAHESTGREMSALKAATAGIVAGAGALAAGELIAAFAAPRPGPVTAVANRVVDNAPTFVVDFGKDLFGLGDKVALIIGTLILSAVAAALFGLASRRSLKIGAAGIGAFGLIGFWAMAVDAQSSAGAAFFIALVAVLAGIGVLAITFRAADGPVTKGLVARAEAEANGKTYVAPVVTPAVSRRTFLGWTGGLAALAGFGALAAQNLRNRFSATEARASVQLAESQTAEEVASLVAEANMNPVAQVSGITPIVVPNEDFYRIDTALLVPQVDPASWTLTIDGLVDEPKTYTYDDLLARATTIAPVTLSCVSNEVGGDLVGNAVWQGVPLIELLDEAGVRPEASQISSRSVDGWTCGFPTDLAYDGRTALVAVAMNGEPLPIEHGFPVRLVISGLYGYVSATKWLSSITMTTLEDFNGYWIPRGWSKSGPIKTESRIDTPRIGSTVAVNEPTPIAGVAWAPNKGIDRVEVQVDDGPWLDAELGDSLGINSWRQWHISWEPTPGDHQIRVRATDGSGETQTEVRANPAPNGASGWHTIVVRT